MGGRVGGIVKFTLAAAVPAMAGGAIKGLLDGKILGKQSAPVQILGTLGVAAALGAALRRHPVTAAALMGGILGPVGSSLTARLQGGIQTSSATQTQQALGLLIREDPYAARAMSALIDTAGRPMNTPSLHGIGMGATALPETPIGTEVNLG
jgi:hypothetical protein